MRFAMNISLAFAEQQLIFQKWAHVVQKALASQIRQTDAVGLFTLAKLELKKIHIVC